MFVKGLNGQIELTNMHVIITRQGFMAAMSKGAAGERTIPISDIDAIQFKPASFMSGNGFIQFCLPGSTTHGDTLQQAVNDPNAVVFTGKANQEFALLHEQLKEVVGAEAWIASTYQGVQRVARVDADPGSGQEPAVRCPKCHSTSLSANQKGFGAGKAAVGFLVAGPLGLAAGGIGSGKVIITCLNCGHKFKPGQK